MTSTMLTSRTMCVARRAILPGIVFAAVVLVHFAYLAVFPERDPAQDRWLIVSEGARPALLQRYIQTQSYWLGFSYGLSLAFAAVAFRRYRERRSCAARNLAIGGVTLSGFLAVAACFLLGCCGSPMLGVYLGLFGAAFVPLAKPLIAGVNLLVIAGSYCWLRHSERRFATQTAQCGCSSPAPCSPAGPPPS